MKHSKSRQTACPNCGSRISIEQNFCQECGQENRELNVPLQHLIAEAVENVFHFDTKTIRSLTALLFRPGFLTLEFTRGKRASYVPPVRLYVFISFVFFLVLTLPKTSDRNPAGGEGHEGSYDAEAKVYVDIHYLSIHAAQLRGLNPAQLDSVITSNNLPLTKYNRYIVHQLARIGSTEISEFRHQVMKSVSYMMFLLMPFFGFIVYLFFRKNAKYYFGALIFSIHYHSFMFLVLIVLVFAAWVSGWSLILFLPLLIFPWYLYGACRCVYNNSPGKTLWKVIAVGVLQFALSVALFLITVVINVITF